MLRTGPAGSRLPRVFGLTLLILAASCSRGGGENPDEPEALVDGEVTTAEYRAAIAATVECIEADGYSATVQTRTDGVMAQVSVGLSSSQTGDPGARDAALSTYDRCFERYAYDTERQYFLQHVPTGAERDSMFGDLLACLTSADVSGLTRTSTEQEIVGAIWAQHPDDPGGGMACLDHYRFVFPEGRYP